MIKIVPKPQNTVILSQQTFKSEALTVKKVFESGHGREGYKLVTAPGEVTFFASEKAGMFYAEKTYMQLASGGDVSHVEITDFPQFSYRGYMLDCSRHFFTVEEIKKMLDAVSLLKINVFHWHLTDDQGFRIEIKKYPALTEIGGKRKATKGDNIPVEGFYTQEEIKDVIAYAAERFIEVIPEIDLPGHMSAAIAAIPELSCGGKGAKIKETFGIYASVACAGRQSTYNILFDILDEVAALFPSRYIHLGGDEALRLSWMDCPDCRAVMEQYNLKDFDELQAHFMAVLTGHLKALGKKVINWNDGMIGDNADPSITVHYWRENKISREAAIRHANAGKDIIFSPFFSYYLDYPHGMTSLKKAYEFNPYVKELNDPARVIGVEAPLWTEYVKDNDRLERQTFPRLLAVAETGWTSPEQKDYAGFLCRTENILKIFDTLGIKYVTIKNSNPSFLKGKAEIIRFFAGAFDKHLNESRRLTTQNKRRLRAYSKAAGRRKESR